MVEERTETKVRERRRYGRPAFRKDGSIAVWTRQETRILSMTHHGASAEEIADKIGISLATVKRIRSLDIFQQRLGKMCDASILRTAKLEAEDEHLSAARKTITHASTYAADKLTKLAKDGKSEDRVQLDACKDILDRAGIIRIEGIQELPSRPLSPDEIQLTLTTLREVEEITKRLVNTQSQYVLTKPGQSLPEADLAESPATDDDSEATGSTGQEAVST